MDHTPPPPSSYYLSTKQQGFFDRMLEDEVVSGLAVDSLCIILRPRGRAARAPGNPAAGRWTHDWMRGLETKEKFWGSWREGEQPAGHFVQCRAAGTNWLLRSQAAISFTRACNILYIYHVMTSGSGHRQRLRNAAAVKSFFFFSVIFVGSSVCVLTDTRVSGF